MDGLDRRTALQARRQRLLSFRGDDVRGRRESLARASLGREEEPVTRAAMGMMRAAMARI